MSKAILYDSTLCIGCKACESGCAERWGLPYNDKIAAEENDLGPQADGHRDARRTLQPPAVHELPAAGLRFGVPGGRAAEDRPRTGGLRRR